MRIIAGTKRGMRLLGPKADSSRPVTDRVKESLFSVLYKYDLPAGKIVADLFSGTGSIGLEALSRGAQFVTFVEKNSKIITVLNRNIEKAGFVSESRVIKADAFKVGAPVGFGHQKYELVFVDPPFITTKSVGPGSLLDGLLELLTQQLAGEGVVVVRAHEGTQLLETYGQLQVIERRRWGTNATTILRRRSV